MVNMGIKMEKLWNLYETQMLPKGKKDNKIIKERKRNKSSSLCIVNWTWWVKCLLCERQTAFIGSCSVCFYKMLEFESIFPELVPRDLLYIPKLGPMLTHCLTVRKLFYLFIVLYLTLCTMTARLLSSFPIKCDDENKPHNWRVLLANVLTVQKIVS